MRCDVWEKCCRGALMPRPKLPDDQLKHPRKHRKSSSHREQRDIKEPSKKEKKKWQFLVEAARDVVLMNEERTGNQGMRGMLQVFLPNDFKPPAFWPLFRLVEKTPEGRLMQLNAELVLLALYEYKLSDYTPAMLYAQRRKFLNRLTRAETVVDKIFEEAYNEDIEE
jgi:hypothetical protein